MTLVIVLNNETKTITETQAQEPMVTVWKYVGILYSECNNKIRAHEGQKSLYLILSCEFLFYFSYFIVLKLYIAILSSSFVTSMFQSSTNTTDTIMIRSETVGFKV